MKYFSEIWAFRTQRAKNSAKCNIIKKPVWATVVQCYQLSETTTCLSSDLIKFKSAFRQEKQSLAIVCCQTHESRKVAR